jgi:hypothetical protein
VAHVAQHVNALPTAIVHARAAATLPVEAGLGFTARVAATAAVLRIAREIGAGAVAILLALGARTKATGAALPSGAQKAARTAVLLVVERIDAGAAALDVANGALAFTARASLPQTAGVAAAAAILRIVEQRSTTSVAHGLEWTALFVADAAPAHKIASTDIAARTAVLAIAAQVAAAIGAERRACWALTGTGDTPESGAAGASAGAAILRVAQQICAPLRAQRERALTAAAPSIAGGTHTLAVTIDETRRAATLAGLAY